VNDRDAEMDHENSEGQEHEDKWIAQPTDSNPNAEEGAATIEHQKPVI